MCVEHNSLCGCVWWYGGTVARGSDSNWTKNQSSMLDGRSSKQTINQSIKETGERRAQNHTQRKRGRTGRVSVQKKTLRSLNHLCSRRRDPGTVCRNRKPQTQGL
jgi:hypothetical protein